jgi:hypothetical protein
MYDGHGNVLPPLRPPPVEPFSPQAWVEAMESHKARLVGYWHPDLRFGVQITGIAAAAGVQEWPLVQQLDVSRAAEVGEWLWQRAIRERDAAALQFMEDHADFIAPRFYWVGRGKRRREVATIGSYWDYKPCGNYLRDHRNGEAYAFALLEHVSAFEDSLCLESALRALPQKDAAADGFRSVIAAVLQFAIKVGMDSIRSSARRQAASWETRLKEVVIPDEERVSARARAAANARWAKHRARRRKGTARKSLKRAA